MQSQDKPYISLNPCFFVYFGFGIPHSVVNLTSASMDRRVLEVHLLKRCKNTTFTAPLSENQDENSFCDFANFQRQKCFSFRECSRLVDPGGLFFDVVFFCALQKHGVFFRCRESICLPNVLGIKLGPVASLNHLEVRQKATKTTRKRRSVAWDKTEKNDQMMTETYFPLKLINSKKLSAKLETGGVGVFGFRLPTLVFCPA